MITFYLGGAMRNPNKDFMKPDELEFYKEDVEWRSRIKFVWGGVDYKFLDPCDKHKELHAKRIPVTNTMIFESDNYAIEKSDVCVFNIEAMNDGYPCIGTLLEMGMCIKAGKPFVVITSNKEVIEKHPFIATKAFMVIKDYNDFDPRIFEV
ncbi:nucleoside 2-deoxyribosyltransferase [uncultured Arcobacter sp.]|uniref:nucleoside 2-deoxyribosyltransferase n=1 Tax=uncultured Arcobacter sp. TaxID=165434 RepID=UPI00260DD87E|nr:nucleoside 2-deoxyribosyltransferase [uncultured Arcobacter sp.]